MEGSGRKNGEVAARFGKHLQASHSEYAGLINYEQVRLLYTNLPASLAANLLLAATLAAVQYTVVPTNMMIDWLAAIGLAVLGRTVLAITWWHADSKSKHNTQRWLSLFRIGVVVIGIIWGIGGGLFAQHVDVEHQVYLAFVLAGLCAGAITALAIDWVSVVGLVLPVLLPLALLPFMAIFTM